MISTSLITALWRYVALSQCGLAAELVHNHRIFVLAEDSARFQKMTCEQPILAKVAVHATKSCTVCGVCSIEQKFWLGECPRKFSEMLSGKRREQEAEEAEAPRPVGAASPSSSISDFEDALDVVDDASTEDQLDICTLPGARSTCASISGTVRTPNNTKSRMLSLRVFASLCDTAWAPK